jgi:DNA modification methylase
MVGSGTTLVECKLLGRRAVGVNINPDGVMVAANRLDFSYETLDADYQAPELVITELKKNHNNINVNPQYLTR